jgi:hypothetical protein
VRNAVLAIGAGLIAILCLGGAAAAFVLLSQVRGSPLPFLRSLTLQRQAQSQPCPAPSSLVPGTYLADPVRVSGDWVVLTYAAECATPGQPRQTINGYVAEDGWGSGCGGSGSLQPITPSASGPVTIFVEGPGQCDGVGGAAGLSVIPGVVTGPGAVTAQALFASGPSASAPIRAGRFVIVAPNGAAVCSVRAVDVGGAVLAEQRLGWPSPKVTQGACPQP